MTEDQENVRLPIHIPRDMRHRLRILAAQQEISMSELVRRLITQALTKQGAK